MMVSFKGVHFEKDTILTCVRWYLVYPLSSRHLEEVTQERGVSSIMPPSTTGSRSTVLFWMRCSTAVMRHVHPPAVELYAWCSGSNTAPSRARLRASARPHRHPVPPAILSTSAHPLRPLLAHPTPLRREGSRTGNKAARWHRSCLEMP
jgi:hypothetical protein